MSQASGEYSLTPLQKATLDQYKLLEQQLTTLKNDIDTLNSSVDVHSAIEDVTKLATDDLDDEERQSVKEDLISQLRSLESTLSMVGTLFKSSVFKILVNGEEEAKE